MNERLGGKGYKPRKDYAGRRVSGDWEDSDRGSGNRATKRAGGKVKKKSPTYLAYIKNKEKVSEGSTWGVWRGDGKRKLPGDKKKAKKKEMKEAAPLAAVGKVALGAGKAIAKGVAAVTKAVGKVGVKGAKGAAKSTEKASKMMKRPNIRSYKDPKTGKTNLKQYRQDQKKYQDQKKKKEQVNPDPVENKDDTKKTDVSNSNVGKNTRNAVGNVARKTKNLATSAVGGATAGFGASSFSKESKITFQQFIDKIP